MSSPMHISSSFLVDPAVRRAAALAPSIGMAPTLLNGAAPVEEPPPLPKDETKTVDPRPLRVAHLGPCLFRGGAEQQLIDLAKFLDPKVAVLERCIVTGTNSVDPAVARDFACEIVPASREVVAETLRTFDVLLYWGMELKGWIEPTDERRAVVIYLAHGDSHWTRDLLRNSAHLTDHAIAVSRRVLETTCQNFPSTVVLNGVDTARLATTRSRYEVRAEFGYGDDDFVVGYVGRFSPEKRPETLHRAH
jgi:glycosyltransferase involved in cell wall biosynthesis